jgi:CheY-like chemotaxis protein
MPDVAVDDATQTSVGYISPKRFDHPVSNTSALRNDALSGNRFISLAWPAGCGTMRCALNVYVDNAPFVALIDDDQHSAHLLTRMLIAHGSPDIQWYGNAADGGARLQAVLADINANWPSLLIVDLKAHSGANREFLSSIQNLVRQKGVPVVVMAPTVDRPGRQALLDVGASAVFFRQAELDAYRREAAGIVSFWARSQRLDAVGM